MSGGEQLFPVEEGPSEGAPSPFSGEPGGQTERARAKIGRPAGARNKRDVDAERWYFARGYRDPMERLGELVSEDPRILQAWLTEHAGLDHEGNRRLGPSILEVMQMQRQAAADLMPYLHGKKPIEVQVDDRRLPMLVIDLGTNQLAEAQRISDARALSVGAPEAEKEPSEIKGLEPPP